MGRKAAAVLRDHGMVAEMDRGTDEADVAAVENKGVEL